MCNGRKVNQMNYNAIKAAWKARNRLLAEGKKLLDEGDTLYNEAFRLRDKGYKLLIEGGKHYAAAVAAKHGDKATINWETGEITIL